MIKKIIIIVLSTIFISCSNSYISKENEKKFSVNEVEEIDKIFLSDRNGNNITLSKKENYWQVNEKYRVRPDAIKTLLSTVQQISIQSPVSESSYNNVIKQLATTGVKVEIYYNNSVKTYTVGGSTNNHLGTYMLMDNAEYPYILHILGFNGFLAPRYGIQGYKLNINNWRDNKVFKINSEEIRKLSLYDYNENKNSFTINCQPISLINNESIKIKYNINEVIKYLNHFSDLGCEDFKGYDNSEYINHNQYITQDVTLPKIEGNPNMKCTNEECISIQSGKESSVTYIKYDLENMKYIYICNHCGQKWKSN